MKAENIFSLWNKIFLAIFTKIYGIPQRSLHFIASMKNLQNMREKTGKNLYYTG